jgi:dynein heavy chain
MLNPSLKLIPVGNVLCLFFGVTPATKIDDPNGSGKKVPDWWKGAIGKMSEMSFLNDLLEYDASVNITEDLIKKVKPFLEKDDFKPDQVANLSSVAMNLCKWFYALA